MLVFKKENLVKKIGTIYAIKVKNMFKNAKCWNSHQKEQEKLIKNFMKKILGTITKSNMKILWKNNCYVKRYEF